MFQMFSILNCQHFCSYFGSNHVERKKSEKKVDAIELNLSMSLNRFINYTSEFRLIANAKEVDGKTAKTQQFLVMKKKTLIETTNYSCLSSTKLIEYSALQLIDICLYFRNKLLTLFWLCASKYNA